MPRDYGKPTKSHLILDGKMLKVSIDDLVLPNNQACQFEIVRHPGAAHRHRPTARRSGGRSLRVDQCVLSSGTDDLDRQRFGMDVAFDAACGMSSFDQAVGSSTFVPHPCFAISLASSWSISQNRHLGG